MRIATCLGGVVFALGLGAAVAPADDKSDPKFNDQVFVDKAASGGAHEIQLGTLAKTNAASSEVRKFGDRMVTDHTTVNDWLKIAAKDAKLSVPAKVSDEDQKHIDRLSKLKGAEFDRAYMDHMIADHKGDVALFEQATKQATDGGVRAFAAKALPTLREHLEQANKIRLALGNGQ
jgi:putative membrane protein